MSQILIEELSGKRRTLTLRGPGLPFQGAEWGGEQVVDTTWLPGAPVAVQHVMGPTELPSDWEGEWNTTRLVALPVLWDDGTGEKELVLADDVRDAVDAVRRAGQLLRVTWAAKDNRKVARYGRLTKAVFPTTRADDVKWKATFTWVGVVDASVAVVQSDQGAAAARAAALAATDAQSRIEAATIIQSNPRIQHSATAFTLGNLEQLAGAPRQIAASFARAMTNVTSRFASLGDIAKTVVGTPAALAEQLVDVAIDAVAVSNNFVDTMSRQPVETMTLRNSVKSLLRAASYYGSAEDGAQRLAEQAMTAARQAQQQRTAARSASADPRSLTGSGDILDTYVPRQGDTMLSIAMRFYREDVSYELSRANGLPGATIVPPRFALIIPNRQVIDRLRGQT